MMAAVSKNEPAQAKLERGTRLCFDDSKRRASGVSGVGGASGVNWRPATSWRIKHAGHCGNSPTWHRWYPADARFGGCAAVGRSPVK